MNGNIFNIQHFSTEDGDGIRTTVFFKGCNLRCIWCHNPESISGKKQLLYYKSLCAKCGLCEKVCPKGAHILNQTEEGTEHVFLREKCEALGHCAARCPRNALRIEGRTVTVKEVLDEILEDIDFYRESQGGATLSGGEPLLQPDFCRKLLIELKKYNIHTIIDTAGDVNFEAFEKVIPFTDEFYFDIKAANEQDYLEKCGGNMKRIVSNLRTLKERGCNVTVRIPVIPQFNDDEAYMEKMAGIIAECGIKKADLLPFHNLGSAKYDALGLTYQCRKLSPPAREHLDNLAQKFAIYDIHVRLNK